MGEIPLMELAQKILCSVSSFIIVLWFMLIVQLLLSIIIFFYEEEEEEVVVWYQGYYYTMCITICIDLRIIEGAKYRTSKAFKNYFIKK